MNTPLSTILIRMLIISIFLLLIDLYAYSAFKVVISGADEFKRKLYSWIYWGTVLLVFALVYIGMYVAFTGVPGQTPKFFFFVFGILVMFYLPKLLISVTMLAEDLFRILRSVTLFILSKSGIQTNQETWIERRKFLSQAIWSLATIPFVSVLYGITRGKYKYTVHEVTLKFKDLPKAFHGFKITQLSDIHVGSFTSKDEVLKGIELANAQQSDLLLFTGDLVNNRADEMHGWEDVIGQLNAPFGKYSVFGNHDYGDYIKWPSMKAKRENLEHLKEIHKNIGFRLMLNESVKIEKDGQSINLVGIENWGLPPFPQYGNLEQATTLVNHKEFTILMSHDPSHFDAEVKHFEKDIHLTLSGHTHGFQFGVDIPGIKWSPVKYKYPKWAGRYTENNRHLYVNRGFGYLGFPGRVGIWPEITVITLETETV